MSKREWLRMVKGGEGLTVEFKRQMPKLDRLARSFSAFANSSGGTIFFGVEDDGQPTGLSSVEGTRDLVEQVSQFYCKPRVAFMTNVWHPLPHISILVVEIAEAELKPVQAVNVHDRKDAWPFFRSGKENLPLDRKSVKAMRRTPAIAPTDHELHELDRHIIQLLNFLHESPNSTLNQMAKSANISSHRAKKMVVKLEERGWIHGFFNEKRREYSVVIPWKRR